MDLSSQALQRLVKELERLPGVGRKTAERLAYHVLRAPPAEALELADAIRAVKEHVRYCKRCFNIAEGDLCRICQDDARDARLVCVVEEPRDVHAIEQSGIYRGRYHVLQGSFAPLEGVAPEDLTIEPLLERLRRGGVAEVIIATNPSFEGEGTAMLLRDRIKELELPLKVTRLARGMPSGSHIEHVSRAIVSDAIEGRREMD